MVTILEVLLLLISFLQAHGQVNPQSGINIADFATDVMNIDMSAAYGNSSAPITGPSYTITYPSGFVSSSAPMLMLSIKKWEYYQSVSDLYLNIYASRSGIYSTYWTVSYGSKRPYYIKTLSYYYLVISSKYSSSPYFIVLNELSCTANQNITANLPFTCSFSIGTTFTPNQGTVVPIASLFGIDSQMNSNQLLGYNLEYSSMSGSQVNYLVKGAFT